MKWKKFTLTTTTQAVDLISSMFDDIGIEGIEIEDNVPLTGRRQRGCLLTFFLSFLRTKGLPG